MSPITWIHIAGGLAALATGTAAFALRKGSSLHARAGIAFCVAMFVLGITALILAPLKTPAQSPVGGVMVCYFVATAWMAAHRRCGQAGLLEKLACGAVLVIGAAILAEGIRLALSPTAPAIPPPMALVLLGGLCLVAGVGDLRFIRGQLSPTQRLTRHLWRMCFAFFIATGSFLLGQQDVLPQAMRGSPVLFVLAFAPFGLMLFWLVRVRYSRMGERLPARRERGEGVRPAPDGDTRVA